MTRGHMPVLICDGDDGFCGETETDYYEQCASTVNGVPITQAKRAPGWESDEDSDLCPGCARQRREGTS